MVSKLKFLGLSFLIVIFFPLFPKSFGNNSQHILIIAVLLAFINLTLNWKVITIRESRKLLYFLFLFFLITVGLLLELFRSNFGLQFSDFLPLSRPFYLGLFFMLGYTSKIDPFRVISKLGTPLKIIVSLGVIYSLTEIFLIDFIKGPLYFLFKRAERVVLIDKSTTWFGVTYYSGFFWLIISSLTFHFSDFKRNKILFGIMVIGSLIPLFLSQSRTILIAFILGVLLMFFDSKSFTNNHNKKNSILRTIKIFFLLGIISFTINEYYEMLLVYFGYVLNTFELLVNGKYYLSNSLMTRMDQILYAISTNRNVVFGWGLGRGIALESMYAAYYYRYGLPFLILTVVLILNVGLKMRKLTKKNLPNAVKGYCRSMYLLMVISPIAFFSSPILETPKIGFIYFFLIGLSLKLHEKIKYNNTKLQL